MKVISIEPIKGGFGGFIDDGPSYFSFTALNGEDVELGYEYRKEQYADYETFAAIFGKFDPYVFFLKEPVEIEELTFESLQEAARKNGNGEINKKGKL